MKIFDEEVIFKKHIVVPEIRIEGGAGDLAIVDDITIGGLATIADTLSVTGTTYLADVTITGSVDTDSATISALTVSDLSATNVDISGTLGVSGTATFVNVNVDGTLTYSTLSLSGDVSFDEITANTAYFVDVQVTGNFTADASAGTFGVTADNITALCTTAYLSASDNIWSLAGYDQHVEASNVLVLDASALNIGTETAYANVITIGTSAISTQTIGVVAGLDLAMDAVSGIDIGTAIATGISIGNASAEITIDGATVNLASANATSVVIGMQDTAQAVEIYGGALTIVGVDLIEADASAINIGTDSSFANAVTIGNLTNTAQTTSLYGGDTLVAYGDAEVNIDGGALAYLCTSSATALTIGHTGMAYQVSAVTAAFDVINNLDFDADTINVGTDTTYTNAITIGHTAATVTVDGAVVDIGGVTQVDIDGGYVNIGTATTFSNYVVVGNSTFGSFSVGTVTASIDAAAINIGTDTAYANAITVGDSSYMVTAEMSFADLAVDVSVEAYVDAGTFCFNNDGRAATVEINKVSTTTQVLNIYGNSVNVEVVDSVGINASAINIGTDSAYANAIAVGNDAATEIQVRALDIDIAATTTFTVSAAILDVDATDTVSLDGAEINIGTDTAYANAITIGANGDTSQAVSVYGGNLVVEVDGLVAIDGSSLMYFGSVNATAVSLGGSLAAMTLLEGTAVSIGTTYATELNIANTAATVSVEASTFGVVCANGIVQRAGYNADSDDNEIDHLLLNGAHGLLIVLDETNSKNGVFRLQGNAATVVQADAAFTITKDTDTKINIYWEANDFHMQNMIDAGNMKLTWSFYGVRLQP